MVVTLQEKVETELESEPEPIQNQRENQKETPVSRPIVGIIYPPPEVRNIVDKTAGFVARNGPEFEARIRQNELNNPKFNFLNPGDPYNGYYQYKVKEFKEGKAAEPVVAVQKTTPLAPSKTQEVLKVIEPPAPKEPPPEFEFIADPPSISSFDLDIVKLTAQFVARNGRQFLTNLMNREQRNFQFDFLRPQHSLFSYFTKLVEQYTKILIPPNTLVIKLKKESQNPKEVLDQVRYRVEWARYQERQKRREEEEAERERVAYAQVDWHDFVVVETVDFQPNEHGNFPPPTTPDEVGARVLMHERLEQDGDTVEMEVDSEEELSDAENSIETAKTAPPGTTTTTAPTNTTVTPAATTGASPFGTPAAAPGTTPSILPVSAPGAKPLAVPGVAPAAVLTVSKTAIPDTTTIKKAEEERKDKGPPQKAEKEPEPEKKEPEKPPPAPVPPPPLPPPSPSDSFPQPPPMPPTPEQVIVRKDYNPKAIKPPKPVQAPDQYLISPITGEKIPADKVQEHMRIGLLDPRWLEQRDRGIAEKQAQEEVYAPGSAIGSSLKQLAERRTDIFGVGDEETAIGKKIGEEEVRREEKVTWDGHTASMEAAARAARANITLEEQIAQIHKVKGLLPDEEKEKIGPAVPTTKPPTPAPPPIPVTTISVTSVPLPTTPAVTTAPILPPPRLPMMPPRPPMPVPRPPLPQLPPGLMPPHPMMMMQPHPSMVPPPGTRPPPGLLGMPPRPPLPPGPPPMVPPPVFVPQLVTIQEDEPPAKKQKTEESLIPEETFLQKNKGPVTFKVHVPSIAEKPEWKLSGQILTLTLPLTDAVSVIKAKLHEEVGMPAGKQKLHHEGLFFKDSNSLAFYNVTNGATIQLQLKERGGRKK